MGGLCIYGHISKLICIMKAEFFLEDMSLQYDAYNMNTCTSGVAVTF